ncbi:hypothetical protein [Pandoraea sp.]|uniref:hypothetical protein n=1 Tax=Pandoraea sp. TaxID=1883445 RepID=UPI0035B4D14F
MRAVIAVIAVIAAISFAFVVAARLSRDVERLQHGSNRFLIRAEGLLQHGEEDIDDRNVCDFTDPARAIAGRVYDKP